MDWEIKRRSNGGIVHMDLYINRHVAASASAYPDLPGQYEAFIDLDWHSAGSLMIDDLTSEHAIAFAAGLVELMKRIREEFAAIQLMSG